MKRFLSNPSARIRDTDFVWGSRTYVMAAINITPDSFSGDGVLGSAVDDHSTVQSAVHLAMRAAEEGADIIDIGGESTRPRSVYPDAHPVEVEEELRRVLPVIRAVRERVSIPISIDTRKSDVAREAIGAGADLVNDVSMLGDPHMAGVIASTRKPIVLSHIRPRAEYRDVMADICSDLQSAIVKAVQDGVPRNLIIVDPGIGFAKRAEHSLEVLRRLGELRLLGLPVLVGTSRKSFIGAVLDLPVHERMEGTAATVVISIVNGADIVRIHDVKAMVRVARMTDAIVRFETAG